MKTREEILALAEPLNEQYRGLDEGIEAFYRAARADGLEEAAELVADRYRHLQSTVQLIRALNEQS